MTKNAIFLAILWLCTSLEAEIFNRAGEAEFAFVESYQSTRAKSMGGAYTALADNLDAALINPAGIRGIKSDLVLEANWEKTPFDDTRAILSMGEKIDSLAVSLSLAYTNNGEVVGLDVLGNPTGTIHRPGNLVTSFAGAFPLWPGTDAGFGFKGITERLVDDDDARTAFGWAVDLGIRNELLPRRLVLGLAAVNLGRKETPHIVGGSTGGLLNAMLRAGIAYRPTSLRRLIVDIDMEKPLFNNYRIRAGAEYRPSPWLALRGGSRGDLPQLTRVLSRVSGNSEAPLPAGHYSRFFLGAGVLLNKLRVDYALTVPTAGLAPSHALGLGWDL